MVRGLTFILFFMQPASSSFYVFVGGLRGHVMIKWMKNPSKSVNHPHLPPWFFFSWTTQFWKKGDIIHFWTINENSFSAKKTTILRLTSQHPGDFGPFQTAFFSLLGSSFQERFKPIAMQLRSSEAKILGAPKSAGRGGRAGRFFFGVHHVRTNRYHG